ncbi:adhesion G protein-coupled receptor E2-like [Gigantopelta aegis]|uniref:adhesion G protein-coupled receptor E2-like n=1 Tax=Gigantopelta aegis TaxID=1735272 RepID=UPI001B88D2A5|nr:adhesion G protein-coupled receptor E2-like [Gigantopelta aegis]
MQLNQSWTNSEVVKKSPEFDIEGCVLCPNFLTVLFQVWAVLKDVEDLVEITFKTFYWFCISVGINDDIRLTSNVVLFNADTNECQTEESSCDVHADCNNTPGSYTCICRDGYTGDGRTCTNINDCFGQNPCDTNAICNITDGSYMCTCKAGYSGDGQTCNDIDECLVKTSCGTNANCTNTDGSYTCTCRDGYTGDGRSCTDIDECLVQTSCGTNVNCTNTDGSYTCTCLNGYSEDGQTSAGHSVKHQSLFWDVFYTILISNCVQPLPSRK